MFETKTSRTCSESSVSRDGKYGALRRAEAHFKGRLIYKIPNRDPRNSEPAPSAGPFRCAGPSPDGYLAKRHIYLKAILDFFPSEVVGGSDKTQIADRLLTVTFVPGMTVRSDIAGADRFNRPRRSNHRFLRDRTAVRDFFERSGAKPGDVVQITRTGTYAYTFSLG